MGDGAVTPLAHSEKCGDVAVWTQKGGAMERPYDAVVVGAGINGMVAAAELAQAGWRVALVERNHRIGGFIATEERTKPGFLHDTYSSWHSQFVSGGAYGVLGEELHACGLEYANSEDDLCATLSDDGEVTFAYRSPRQTAAQFKHPADARVYRAAIQRVVDNSGSIGALMSSELRSLTSAQVQIMMLRANGLAGSEHWARDLVTSGRSWCRREFEGMEVERLWVPWLLHAGLSPDHASGGFFIPLFAANLHRAGVPVVVGGAGNFVRAFLELLESLGVVVMTGVTVDHVVLDDGSAVGVSTVADGTVYGTSILASVTPTALYGELLPEDAATPRIVDQAARFRFGRGAMQIHVALDAPLAWRDERLSATPIVHLSDGGASTGIACAEAEAGLLPGRPTVVVGRQEVLDPSRVPPGKGALWIQLNETPFRPVGDAREELDVSAGWTKDLARRYAYRVLDRLAPHVHHLKQSVLEIDAITPVGLHEYNLNATAGDPYGGDSQLDQNFLWRPLAAASSHQTPVPNLWHIGASTHPGAGLGGASGHLVAQRLLASSDGAGRGRETSSRARRVISRVVRGTGQSR